MSSWHQLFVLCCISCSAYVVSFKSSGFYDGAMKSVFQFHPPLSKFRLLNSKPLSSQDVASLDILKNACESRKVLPGDVLSCINQIEASALTVTCSDVKGKWELVYNSIIPGGYFPVTEIADFYGYSLTSGWGPIPFGGFRGKSKIISETNPACIEFSSEIFKIGQFELKVKNPKSRSYTFLYADQNFAVARSSGGGGTLLKKISD